MSWDRILDGVYACLRGTYTHVFAHPGQAAELSALVDAASLPVHVRASILVPHGRVITVAPGRGGEDGCLRCPQPVIEARVDRVVTTEADREDALFLAETVQASMDHVSDEVERRDRERRALAFYAPVTRAQVADAQRAYRAFGG